MTQTTTLPTGITQLPEPCWELFYADSDQVWDNGEDTPHFNSEAQADAFIEGREADAPPLVPRRNDTPCWTATAACTMPLLLDDGIGTAHWPRADEALRDAQDSDWSVIDGVLRCEDGMGCTA